MEVCRVNCPNCSSTQIEEGIAIGKSAEGGSIGPKDKWGIMIGVT